MQGDIFSLATNALRHEIDLKIAAHDESAHPVFAHYHNEEFSAIALYTYDMLYLIMNGRIIWAKSALGVKIISIQQIQPDLHVFIATTLDECMIHVLKTGEVLT